MPDKFPPTFLNMSNIEVYVGSTFTLQLYAEDRNNDSVTFSLLSVLPNSSITRGKKTVDFIGRCINLGLLTKITQSLT